MKLGDVNFSAGQPVKELKLATIAEAGSADGDVTTIFAPATAFSFIAADNPK